MKNYRPLFLRSLDLRLPGLKVRRLQLNRHLRETEAVSRHRHAFAQVLLYLSGGGRQNIGLESHPVRSGTAVLLKSGVQHSFEETNRRRPLCCAIDFELRGAGKRTSSVVQLTASELAEARHLLATLGKLNWAGTEPGAEASALRVGATVLGLLDLLLRRGGWTGEKPAPSPAHAPLVRTTQRTLREDLAEPDAKRSLDDLARKIGYQHDYLNRLLKEATGLTLGQMRAELRMERARQLLARPLSIGDVAEELGFLDQNYFARWFRQQAGQSPSQYRRQRDVGSNYRSKVTR